MSHDPHQTDLRGPSELMRLLEVDFEEIGPQRASGTVAADERHHQPWGLSLSVVMEQERTLSALARKFADVLGYVLGSRSCGGGLVEAL